MEDWSWFRKRIFINTAPERIYEAWTLRSSLETWFLESAEFSSEQGNPRSAGEPFQVGDRFAWKWNNWDVIENGKVLEANGTDRIGFTFGAGGEVYINLTKREGLTEVELIQEKIPQDDKSRKYLFVGCSTGWTFWLTNLKAWLEHGIVLHSKGLSQDETADLVNS